MVLDSSQANTDFSPGDSTELETLIAELPKQYEVLGKIGEGGMGSIVKARNRYTGAAAAIKILRSEAARHEESLRRFIAEAKAASSLKHPNICHVFDFGITDKGVAYLVMDWINGIDLERKVLRDGHLPGNESIHIFQQVASALAYAHRNKVIHRDIKPQNIMLSRDTDGRTEVHLVDFGIAKIISDEESALPGQGLTKVGMVMGTPLYMSPEQACGEKLDNRSDIYSLGCVMYYALTGYPPFLGKSAIETINQHLSQAPPQMSPSLKLSADLKLIVLKAMEKRLEDRYSNMDQLVTDLKKLTKGVTLKHRPLYGQRQSNRKKAIVVLCFIFGFILMYSLSVGLQNLLDIVTPNASAPKGTAK